MRFNSINTRLSISVVLAVFISIFALIAYVATSTHQLAKTKDSQAMQQICSLGKKTLDNYLADLLVQARGLADQESVRTLLQGSAASVADPGQPFRSYIKSSEGLWAAFVFDAEGLILAGANAKGEDMAKGDEKARSRKSRDYVKEILAGQDQYITKEVLKAASGDALIFGVAVAIKDGAGKTVGGVAVFPFWTKFTKEFIDAVALGRTGHSFILDGKGRFIAHPDKGLLLADNVATEPFVTDMLTRKSGLHDYTWNGKARTAAFDHSPLTGWTIAVAVDADETSEASDLQRNILAGAGLAMALILVTLIMVSARKLVIKPLSDIKTFTGEIAAGNLKAVLTGRFQCEMADLAGNITSMVNELKHKLGLAEGVLKGMTVPYLLVDTEERAVFTNKECLNMVELDGEPEQYLGKTLADIFYNDPTRKTKVGHSMMTGEVFRNQQIEIKGHKGGSRTVHFNVFPLYDTDGKCIGGFCLYLDVSEMILKERQITEQNEKIAQTAQNAEIISEQVASAADELSAQVEHSTSGAQEQRGRTTEAATAMEQMNASVLEVSRNAAEAAEEADQTKASAQEGAQVVTEAIQAIFAVRDQTQSMKESLGSLGRQAEEIGKVITVIEDIADQTNLLALNAAIEAARAGDAGRGFAVVADEVRKLAEKTMTATKEVAQAISSIQKGTAGSIHMMEGATKAVENSTHLAEKAGESLKGIVTMVEHTSDRVRTIATAAEEQSAASEQISKALEEITSISTDTADAMAQSAKAINELAGLSGNLKELIQNMRT